MVLFLIDFYGHKSVTTCCWFTREMDANAVLEEPRQVGDVGAYFRGSITISGTNSVQTRGLMAAAKPPAGTVSLLGFTWQQALQRRRSQSSEEVQGGARGTGPEVSSFASG